MNSGLIFSNTLWTAKAATKPLSIWAYLYFPLTKYETFRLAEWEAIGEYVEAIDTKYLPN